MKQLNCNLKEQKIKMDLQSSFSTKQTQNYQYQQSFQILEPMQKSAQIQPSDSISKSNYVQFIPQNQIRVHNKIYKVDSLVGMINIMGNILDYKINRNIRLLKPLFQQWSQMIWVMQKKIKNVQNIDLRVQIENICLQQLTTRMKYWVNQEDLIQQKFVKNFITWIWLHKEVNISLIKHAFPQENYVAQIKQNINKFKTERNRKATIMKKDFTKSYDQSRQKLKKMIAEIKERAKSDSSSLKDEQKQVSVERQ